MRVYIIILNWNGWRETLECLASVFRLKYPDFVVVVCDNGSDDGSLEKIAAWANGDERARESRFLAIPQTPDAARRIPFAKHARAEAEAGAPATTRLVLIDNGANLGFAGGCNVGLRFALGQADMAYAWLLNNDAVVDPEALSALVGTMKRDPGIGICGSQVRSYDKPNVIQTQGGTLNRWLCTTHSLACGVEVASAPPAPSQVDYVPGASMLVSRAYLEKVGLMEESYFLYFEEIDWAERGRSSFRLAICPESVIYHVGGASIGTRDEKGERGVRSEYFLLRNRLVFAHRFYRRRLITVYAGFLASIVSRLARGQWSRARIAFLALIGRAPAVGTQAPPKRPASYGSSAD